MPCPDHQNCDKKTCLEQMVCEKADYWVNYWKNQAVLKTQFQLGMERQIAALKESKKAKKKQQKALERKRNFHAKICDTTGKKCDKHRACGILGQCIFLHPLIFQNASIREQLKGPLTTKDIVKVITPTMPSIGRLGQRRYYIEFMDENR
jgi:hypothetical protein